MTRRKWGDAADNYKWLVARKDHEGDGCLIWPFSRKETGYGQIGRNGRVTGAHRVMCELVNGPAPTPNHEASHECGNGHLGCVHPKHLTWKTRAENRMDRRRHGTANSRGPQKLNAEKVREIRALLAKKTRHEEIARRYGITRKYVYSIKAGLTWKNVGSLPSA